MHVYVILMFRIGYERIFEKIRYVYTHFDIFIEDAMRRGTAAPHASGSIWLIRSYNEVIMSVVPFTKGHLSFVHALWASSALPNRPAIYIYIIIYKYSNICTCTHIFI